MRTKIKRGQSEGLTIGKAVVKAWGLSCQGHWRDSFRYKFGLRAQSGSPVNSSRAQGEIKGWGEEEKKEKQKFQ